MQQTFEIGDRVHAPFMFDEETNTWENCKGQFQGIFPETGDFIISFGLNESGNVVNDPSDGHSVTVVEKMVNPKHVIGHYRYVEVALLNGEKAKVPTPLNF